jgi:hypothetical protein
MPKILVTERYHAYLDKVTELTLKAVEETLLVRAATRKIPFSAIAKKRPVVEDQSNKNLIITISSHGTKLDILFVYSSIRIINLGGMEVGIFVKKASKGDEIYSWRAIRETRGSIVFFESFPENYQKNLKSILRRAREMLDDKEKRTPNAAEKQAWQRLEQLLDEYIEAVKQVLESLPSYRDAFPTEAKYNITYKAVSAALSYLHRAKALNEEYKAAEAEKASA